MTAIDVIQRATISPRPQAAVSRDLIGIVSTPFAAFVIQGPSSTVRATFRGVSSLLRHASAGTLSSVSGVTNALSRNLGSQVVRPIAGTMGLVRGRQMGFLVLLLLSYPCS